MDENDPGLVLGTPSIDLKGLPLYNESANDSAECDVIYQVILTRIGLSFNNVQLARVLVTWLIFVFSFVSNSSVLLGVIRWRKREPNGHSQLVIVNLCLANLCFTFFILPMDAVWNSTVQWFGGDVTCRILNTLKQFSMYISSAVVVVMGVDKVMSLLSPCTPMQQRQRVKLLLTIAWVTSFLCAVPASAIFSVGGNDTVLVCNGQLYQVKQCIDFNYLGKEAKRYYYFYTMCVSFFIPLIAIVCCYVIIMLKIAKMAKKAKETEQASSGFRPKRERKSLARQSLDRARKVWQLTTALITLSFLACWTPYYFTGIIFWMNNELLNSTLNLIMVMSNYFYPCLQPLIMVALMPHLRNHICCPSRRRKKQQPGSTCQRPTVVREVTGSNCVENGNAPH